MTPRPRLALPPHDPPYLPLASGPVLLGHAQAELALDAPDLPDDLRTLHWHAWVCLAAILYLIDHGDGVNRETLVLVLRDFSASLDAGRAAYAPLAADIQRHGGYSPPPTESRVQDTAVNTVFLFCERAVKNVRAVLGENDTFEDAAARWGEVVSAFASDYRQDRGRLWHHRRLMLLELRTFHEWRERDSPRGGRRAPRTPRKPPSEGRVLKVLKHLEAARMRVPGYALRRATGTTKNDLAHMAKQELLHSDREGYALTETGLRAVREAPARLRSQP